MKYSNDIILLAMIMLLSVSQISYSRQRGTTTTSVGHSDQVKSVAISQNGRLVLSGSSDKTSKLWDFRSRRLLRTLKGHTEQVNCVAFSPNGKTGASGAGGPMGTDATIRIWNLVDGSELKVLRGHNYSVNSIAFSPDGKLLVSGGGSDFGKPPYDDKVVRIWDVATGKLLRTLEGHTSSITCVAFAPDGNHVLSGGGDGDHTIRVWNVHNGQLLRVLRGHSKRIECLAISPDGRQAVTGEFFMGSAPPFIVWDLKNGTLIRKHEGAGGGPCSADFSPNGQYIAMGQYNGIFGVLGTRNYELSQIFGASKLVGGEPSGIKHDPASWVLSIAFSPDSGSIITGHQDSQIKLWNRATGRFVDTFPTQSVGNEHAKSYENSDEVNNDIIYDSKTGLEWCTGPNRDMNWKQARNWVGNLKIGGGDWRMPTRGELRNIYQRYDKSKFIDADEASFVWSGDRHAPVDGYEQAYRLNFYNGDIDFFSCVQSWMYRALAVRKRTKQSVATRNNMAGNAEIFRDDFLDAEINNALWRWDQTKNFSYRGWEIQKYNVAEERGYFLLESYAAHKRGWTSI